MLAGAHAHHAVAARREIGVVGDEHERRAALGDGARTSVDDLAAGRLVEIAGRLVGDEDRGMRRQRARERDALLLAARKLRRIMREALAEPDRCELAPSRALERVGGAGELERHRDVLERRHGRDEVEGLEHDADLAAAKARERILVEPADFLARDRDRARIGPLQPGHHHQQRRFARARRTDQADRLAAPYIERDVLEDMNPRRAAAERQVDARKRDGRQRERSPPRCRSCGVVPR